MAILIVYYHIMHYQSEHLCAKTHLVSAASIQVPSRHTRYHIQISQTDLYSYSYNTLEIYSIEEESLVFDKRFGLSNSKTFWSDEDLSGGAPPCSWAPEVPDVLGSSHSTFVADDLSALNLHLLVEPLPVAAALHAALACAAVRTCSPHPGSRTCPSCWRSDGHSRRTACSWGPSSVCRRQSTE